MQKQRRRAIKKTAKREREGRKHRRKWESVDVYGGEEDGQNEKEEDAVKNKQSPAESRERGGGAAMPASPFRPHRVAW